LPPEVDTVSLSSFNPDTQNYIDSSGSPSLAQFFFATTETVQVVGAAPMISGQMSFGATIINDRADLGVVNASINSRTASFSVLLFGESVYSLPATSLPTSGQPNYIVPFFSFDIPFQISICVVNISASMTGSVGVNYSVGPTQAKSGGTVLAANFTPNLMINSTYSATIGIGFGDIVSVNVGVSGTLLIVNLQLPVTASAQFDMVSMRRGTDQTSLRSIYACQAQFKYGLKASLTATFLSGTVNLVVTGCFFFCHTFFNQQIENWSGITPPAVTVLQMSNAAPFGSLYTDLPEYGYTLANSTFSKDDSSGAPTACTGLAKQLNIDLAQT
jgi:hypothetical protein